ncbi:MAG: DUF3097 family protein [Actinomycetaceae bacterium]|nr:DUF3097 domain-containing protein [Arcanobacterium sp.]MDD7505395.1 DUF3097 family protein [Actinomycetaceae bacterium]
MAYFDAYGSDVLSHDPREPRTLAVEVGMIVEDVSSGYVGEVMEVRRVGGQWQMVLEDADRKRRSFPLGVGYWLEGEPVNFTPPAPQARDGFSPTSDPKGAVKTVAGKKVTASGSLHVDHAPRVARPSRIWVEGKHDAELISKIWGEDLAYEGIMLEELFGADHLLEVLEAFEPSDRHRAGVLLDHMLPGTKEWKIAQQAQQMDGVLVLGHPYIDVWQAIKPSTLGISAWPEVPRGEDIKRGTLARLGIAHDTPADIGYAWARMLARVHHYSDLEPGLLGRMEELIDFVTQGE